MNEQDWVIEFFDGRMTFFWRSDTKREHPQPVIRVNNDRAIIMESRTDDTSRPFGSGEHLQYVDMKTGDVIRQGPGYFESRNHSYASCG